MRPFLHRFPAIGSLLLFALLCAVALAAPKYFQSTATLTVTNTNDSGPGSLRQALAAAQNGDTIQFDPALNGQSVTLTTAELVVGSSVIIDGPGPSLLTIGRDQQAPDFRIFHILPGNSAEIRGLTITGGRLGNDGGGVFSDAATLTISNCTISGNSILTPMGSPAHSGGGIHNTGTLTLVNSTTRLNQAVWFGGSFTYGGGISNAGTMTISQDLIETNTSDWHGGGILNDGLMMIADSTISGNRSGGTFSHFTGQGGGIYNRSGTLTIQNSAISGNNATGDPFSGWGGGIFNTAALTITHSTISGNQCNRFGGGIYGNADITDSIISNNHTLLQDGGGIAGGGTITNSTISGNISSGFGGGIAGFPTIVNSTISGNTTNQRGGAIYGGGIITNCTISGNTVNGGPGGGIYASGALEIGNTVLKAGATGSNIFNNGGTVTSHGYNVSSDNGGGFLIGPGDQINTDPLLGPLQNNGGPTFTHELLTGSPAIDTGDPNFTPPPSTDQRGYARVFNGRIDIGSFEVQPAPTPSPSATSTATATATSTSTATATATATATIPPPTPSPTVTPTPGCTLTEGFENITTLIPNGWVTQNNSQPAGTTGWFQGTPYETVAAQSGSFASSILANFLNGSKLAIISNWLLTPPVTLQNGAKFSFWTTTVGVNIRFPDVFPDRLQVRMSTNGTSQDVGNAAASVGDFTTLLLDINPTYTTTGYPVGWTNFVVTVSGVPSPVQGRLAFRYFVENGGTSGPNSNHIGIDTVAYYCNGTIATPTPASPTPTPSVTPTPGTPVSSITGNILMCSNPLPNVRVNITGAISRSDMSDSSGNYWFRLVPFFYNYTVTPEKAPIAPGANGISTTDVLGIQKHFLNLFLIPPGCRLTAADVNADTMINTVDAIAVQRFFLALTTGTANVGKYQFTPASRAYTGNGTNWTGQDYDTVLIGDVIAPFAP